MTYINPRADLTRRPRTLLSIGGTVIPFTTLTLEHSGTYQAGTFHAEVVSRPGVNVGEWGWWLGQGVILADVHTGFPADPEHYGPGDLTPVFTVRIDEVQFEPARNVITLAGRDLTALFIDAQASGQYQNQTASDVAIQFAKAQGLSYQVQPTTDKIGSYYAHDRVHVQPTQSQWAVLTWLARMAGVQCFVLGRTLYFGQFRPLGSADRYLIEYSAPDAARGHASANAGELSFTHDLTLARDVIVTVRSYDRKHPRGFNVIAKTTGSIPLAAQHLAPVLPSSAAAPQNYFYTIPGLDPQHARLKAQELAAEIARHEYRLSAALPGDDVLFPWVQVEVRGTGTIFDQLYYPDTITRRFTPTEYSMELTAKNHPTETEVSLS